jgi:hypothetical protein
MNRTKQRQNQGEALGLYAETSTLILGQRSIKKGSNERRPPLVKASRFFFDASRNCDS